MRDNGRLAPHGLPAQTSGCVCTKRSKVRHPQRDFRVKPRPADARMSELLRLLAVIFVR